MADKDHQTDALTASSQPNNPLSKKLNKLLDTRLDNDKVYKDVSCGKMFTRRDVLLKIKEIFGPLESRRLVTRAVISDDFDVSTKT